MTSGSANPYNPYGARLLALLLDGAAPGDAGRVRHRLGEGEPHYLTWAKLTDQARAHAVSDPDALVRRAVLRAKGLTTDDLAIALERPDPVVDQAVYEHPAALPWMRRRILAPGRYPASTALTPLLDRIRATTQDPPGLGHFIAAAVVSDVPEVAEHALRTCGTALTTAEQLRGVQSLLPHPERLRALLDAPTALLRGDVGDVARTALDGDDGACRLRAAVIAAEGAEGLIAGLRAGEAEPGWRRTPDWDALAAAHGSQPLPEAAVRILAARPDCPEPLLADFYRAHPVTVADIARPCAAVLRAAARTPGHPELLRLATALGEADEDTGAAVLDGVVPARTAAAALAEVGGAAAAPLRARLRRHLGADPRRWATLRVALSRHKGTLADLLAAIADGTVPAPAPTAKVPALSKPYRSLLYAAEPEDLRDLLPQLPDELLAALLGKGALPAHALDAALAAADPRARAAIGGNVALGARELRRLVERDEPAVNGTVYRNQKATLTLRRAIASGVPRTPGRTEPLPLDARLRAELLASEDKFLCTPLVTSGDPELVAHAWQLFPTDEMHRFAVVRVWERGGPDAVRTLIALLPEGAWNRQVIEDTRAALGHPDGVERLRADMQPYEDPDRLPWEFAHSGGRNATRRLMRTIVHEPYTYDFPRLIAAHHEHTFEPEPIAELLRHEDVDEEIRVALTASRPYGVAGTEALQDGVFDPLVYLQNESWPRHGRWFDDAVRQGTLSAERLIDTARPAPAVLASLFNDEDPAVRAAARRRVRELVREHLAGHPEGWVIALHLVESFTGTLAELLTAAAQAAGPRPGAEALARLDASRQHAEAEAAAHEPAPAPPEKNLHFAERKRLDEALDTRAAVAAIDLLRNLVPGAPLPTDSDVLEKLADTSSSDIPGHAHPDWLEEACRTHGTAQAVKVLASQRGPAYAGFTGRTWEVIKELAACRNGHIAPSEMVARQPAERLDPLPAAWRDRGGADQLRAVRRLVDGRLGADPRRWLRALAAMDTERARRPFGELLDHATTDDGPDAPTALTPAAAGLLLHADADALAAVLPRLDPRAALTLIEKACARKHLTEAVLDHVCTHGDRAALLVLAKDPDATRQHPGLWRRLLSADDPVVNAVLYGPTPHSSTPEIRRTILSRRPQGRPATGPDDLLPLTPELRARLLEKFTFIGRGYLHPYRVLAEAADAELVEHAIVSWGKWVPLMDHLLVARNSLRHGGPDHLRSLVDRGLLSTAAAKVATKALASPDPDAVLTARLDLELSTERLVAKLRACKEYEEEKILDLPYRRDWDVLVRAHEEEPLPERVWSKLVRLPDAPPGVARGITGRWSPVPARALAERSHELARAAITAPPQPGDRRERFGATLDSFLEASLLTGSDLLHHAEGANRVLHYLREAALRHELPTALENTVHDATKELVTLADRHLGDSPAAWQRLYAGLTGKDRNWPRPGAPVTVAALLEHAAKPPLV
ncbi:hypothetical protein HUT19_02715 [Streptomyces sp. NA02950]|uniref:hypothetical protein n=1 Tax=Streptomyces sp. NA02950 TaxID=2742137 RepID=UPI00159026BB|nr:hypothetical protein [Streptomyces sp. NA02950]QKV90786.1 hypothetical protein HUT19_02715 [Streptomyces sp. NA02950]